MSLFDSMNVAYSGMQAASAGLAATSHNVANANTDGYTRRSVETSTTDPIASRGLFLGQGVSVDDITRNLDTLLAGRTLQSAGLASFAEAEEQALSQIEHLFEDDLTSTTSDKLTGFFDALTAATADPSDDALRLGVASAGEDLALSFADTAASLDTAVADLATQVVDMGADVNARLDEIASLNEALKGAGGALSAGDIADQLDVALRGLAEDYGMTADYEADGTATVMFGDQAVVSGGEARDVTFADDGAGGVKITVAVGAGVIDVTDEAGGTVGGQLSAMDSIRGYRAELDSIAADLADALNAQHTAGFDSAGNPGGDLFTYDPALGASSMQFNTAISDDPSLLAFAADPTASAGDSGNLAALIDLEDASIVGGQTPGAAMSSLKATVGADVAAAGARADSEAAARDDLDTMFQQLYGVDLDEEAVNLITFQAAYEASAKVLQIADEMLGTLLELA